MKNPQLMLKSQGRRFRVVIVGDTYQGPKRGVLYVPGQPRKGLVRAEALQLAAQWTPNKVFAYAGAREGSYVYPSVRPHLIPIAEAFHGGTKSERPARPQVAEPNVPARNTEIEDLGEASDLLMQRRAALRGIAEIDAKLAKLLDIRAVEVIQRGMASPLNGHRLSIQ
jgi:hypothetical protein